MNEYYLYKTITYFDTASYTSTIHNNKQVSFTILKQKYIPPAFLYNLETCIPTQGRLLNCETPTRRGIFP